MSTTKAQLLQLIRLRPGLQSDELARLLGKQVSSISSQLSKCESEGRIRASFDPTWSRRLSYYPKGKP